ncbi:hypothetical protein NUACC21_54220 [Scytonema sp. NUACC21]
MYITENLRLVLAKLDTLTPLELEKVQETINRLTSLNRLIKLKYRPPLLDSSTSRIIWNYSNSETALESLSSNTSQPKPFDISVNELVGHESVKKTSRPLGIWKGQVEISEDFYKTSSDILSELGIEE